MATCRSDEPISNLIENDFKSKLDDFVRKPPDRQRFQWLCDDLVKFILSKTCSGNTSRNAGVLRVWESAPHRFTSESPPEIKTFAGLCMKNRDDVPQHDTFFIQDIHVTVLPNRLHIINPTFDFIHITARNGFWETQTIGEGTPCNKTMATWFSPQLQLAANGSFTVQLNQTGKSSADPLYYKWAQEHYQKAETLSYNIALNVLSALRYCVYQQSHFWMGRAQEAVQSFIRRPTVSNLIAALSTYADTKAYRQAYAREYAKQLGWFKDALLMLRPVHEDILMMLLKNTSRLSIASGDEFVRLITHWASSVHPQQQQAITKALQDRTKAWLGGVSDANMLLTVIATHHTWSKLVNLTDQIAIIKMPDIKDETSIDLNTLLTAASVPVKLSDDFFRPYVRHLLWEQPDTLVKGRDQLRANPALRTMLDSELEPRWFLASFEHQVDRKGAIAALDVLGKLRDMQNRDTMITALFRVPERVANIDMNPETFQAIFDRAMSLATEVGTSDDDKELMRLEFEGLKKSVQERADKQCQDDAAATPAPKRRKFGERIPPRTQASLYETKLGRLLRAVLP